MAGLIGMLVLVTAVIFIAAVKRTSEAERAAVFRLGVFKGVQGPGRFAIVPFIDRIQRIDLGPRTSRISTPRGPATITWRVVDPSLAVTATADYAETVVRAAETAWREAPDRFALRGMLNERLRSIGVSVDAVDA